jgi:hypothetical protein
MVQRSVMLKVRMGFIHWRDSVVSTKNKIIVLDQISLKSGTFLDDFRTVCPRVCNFFDDGRCGSATLHCHVNS